MEYLAERIQSPSFHDLNPFNVQQGQRAYNILIDCNMTTHSGEKWDWAGRVAVPLQIGDTPQHLEEVATIAFRVAQQHGLPSSLMSLCSFYYYDDDPNDPEESGWVNFL